MLSTNQRLLFDIKEHSSKYVGIQVDHTTANNYDPYTNLCVQLVNVNFSVHSISVGTFEYKGKHTADALYESCEGKGGLVEKWHLQDFKCVYTADSFSGNVKAFRNCDTVGWVPCMAHVIHNTVKHGLEKVEAVKTLHKKMQNILQYCHKSPENLHLIKGNAKWLGLPELTLTSECPTHWNSLLNCAERLVKVSIPLNATLHQAEKNDLMLDNMDLNLLKDLIVELQEFKTITNMLCTNTQFSFNNYWPMKELIESMLARDVDIQNTNQYKTIKEFRSVMLSHFQKFDLTDKTTRLAKTASMLDPKHMLLTEDTEILPFADHIVKILEDDVPNACEPETQMVGPLQSPVSLTVNIPKTQDNQNKNAKASKNPYVKLFNPRYNLVKKKHQANK